MRLAPAQIETVRRTVTEVCGSGATVFLFGSRLDDTRRGGDVDLLLETADEVPTIDRARLKVRLEAALGLPIDLVVAPATRPPTPFAELVRRRGVRL